MTRPFRRSILRPALCALVAASALGSGHAQASPRGPIELQAAALGHQQAQRTIARQRPQARSSLQRGRQLQALRDRAGRNWGNDFDVTHTTVRLDAEEAAGSIDAEIIVDIKAQADGVGLLEFYLAALEQLSVTDGDGQPLTVVLDDFYDMATVQLPAPLAEGEHLQLRFHQQGQPNCEPDSYFGMVMCRYSTALVFDANPSWIPMKAAYDYADMNTTGVIDLDIVTPPGMVATTTSPLDAVEDQGGELLHRFTGQFPTSLPALAYGPFATAQALTSSGKPVTTYIHSGASQHGPGWAAVGAEIVDFLSSTYTPYQYAKQDVVQAIEELGGGVGPPSATFYYASALETDPAEFYSESIFAHEIAHSWWGNMIRSGDVYSPWLAEGFAEYSARLYGYQRWPERYQDHIYDNYFRYFLFNVTPEQEVPLTGPAIYTDDSLVYYAITYLKGSQLLRTLQWLLGEQAFFQAMADYSASFVWSPDHDVLVDVPALRAALETASGMDLSAFFERWVYSAGQPTYRYAAELGGDAQSGWTASVRIEQTQTTGIVYDLPIEVSLWVGDEEEPQHHRVEFDGKSAQATFSLNAEPRGLRVDRRSWLWADKISALAGDVDGSIEVDGMDLVYLGYALGSDYNDLVEGAHYLSTSDFDRDGRVDTTDRDMLLGNFGRKGTIHD